MELKTPLYDWHKENGGKIVPFAGYLLPVQYKTGVITEHMAVRQKAGLFDVSHMGEIIIEGEDALKNINNILTNDFTSLQDNRVRYSPMCNEEGGIIDDLIVYRYNQNKYLLVVNASNKEKDFNWIKEHLTGSVTANDRSNNIGQVALQGPNSKLILSKLIDESKLPQKYYSFESTCDIAGVICLVSQTGYTGEFGYELYCNTNDTIRLWTELLKVGEEYGLIPCGLGARDTLRFEASMPLYGHELNDEITPFEAGLNFAIKMAKEDFIGKAALEGKTPPKRKRIGLKLMGRGIARENCDVYVNDEKIGMTTSGTHCPFLGAAYAMALVDADKSDSGKEVEIEVRGKRIVAEIVDMPFYKRA